VRPFFSTSAALVLGGAALLLSPLPSGAQTADDAATSAPTAGDLGFAVWFDGETGPSLSLQFEQPAMFGPRADLRFAIEASKYQSGLRSDVTIANAFGTSLSQDISLNGYRAKGRPNTGENLSYSGGELSTMLGTSDDSGLAIGAGFGAQVLSIDAASTLPVAISDYIAANGARSDGGFIRGQVMFDRSEDAVQPSSGYRLSGGLEAGNMGTAGYGKVTVAGDLFNRIGANSTLHSRLRLGRGVGLGGDDFPVFKNFTAGGAADLRGYGLGGIGPTSPIAGSTKLAHIGGDTAFSGGIEVAHNLGETQTLALIGFVDGAAINAGGQAFADMRSSVGVGLRWSSPIGPLDISYAKALNAAPTDVIEPLQVSFGFRF
jgi:outer membrane protein insertion porin family